MLTRTQMGEATTEELARLKTEIETELAGRGEDRVGEAQQAAEEPVMKHVTPAGTYRWEMVECGHKDRCKRCKSGLRHGPYLYRYYRKDGKQKSEYIKLSEARALDFERPSVPAMAGGR